VGPWIGTRYPDILRNEPRIVEHFGSLGSVSISSNYPNPKAPDGEARSRARPARRRKRTTAPAPPAFRPIRCQRRKALSMLQRWPPALAASVGPDERDANCDRSTSLMKPSAVEADRRVKVTNRQTWPAGAALIMNPALFREPLACRTSRDAARTQAMAPTGGAPAGGRDARGRERRVLRPP
jgi:hypothetical protein